MFKLCKQFRFDNCLFWNSFFLMFEQNVGMIGGIVLYKMIFMGNWYIDFYIKNKNKYSFLFGWL